MKKIIAAIIFTIIVSISVFAQKTDDKTAAQNVINTMFTEMANHNPEAIKAVYTPEAMLAALIKNKEGKTVTRYFSGEAFSKNFAVRKNEIREDMYEMKTEVLGDLALIHGRYVFFSDGKVSHCGVNAFHLVRTDSGWKIANASSTIEPNGCTAKEKKRPAVSTK
jgi:ketosteroid isomerase-like protein